MACLAQSTHFRMGFTGTLVPALAHNQIAFGNNTTNTGIGMGGIATAPGQLNGPGHHCPITV
jgi:hypothetical protein